MPSSPSDTRHVVVPRLPIELAPFIKFAGVTGSGGEAKQLIREGSVLLNGKVETQKGKKLSAGDTVSVAGQTLVVANA